MPFMAALITAKLLNGLRLAGLAAIAGFCATVYLAADFNFEQLTAVRKIILCGLATAFIAPLLDLAPRNGRFARYLIAAACASAALWVFGQYCGKKDAGNGYPWYWHCRHCKWLINSWIGFPACRYKRVRRDGFRRGCRCLGAARRIGVTGTIGVIHRCCLWRLPSCSMINSKPLSCGRFSPCPYHSMWANRARRHTASQATMVLRAPVAAIPVAAHVPLPCNWSLRGEL